MNVLDQQFPKHETCVDLSWWNYQLSIGRCSKDDWLSICTLAGKKWEDWSPNLPNIEEFKHWRWN